MSATPPFGPAYDEQPEDGPRSSPGQWRPRAGRPQGAQGGPGPAGRTGPVPGPAPHPSRGCTERPGAVGAAGRRPPGRAAPDAAGRQALAGPARRRSASGRSRGGRRPAAGPLPVPAAASPAPVAPTAASAAARRGSSRAVPSRPGDRLQPSHGPVERRLAPAARRGLDPEPGPSGRSSAHSRRRGSRRSRARTSRSRRPRSSTTGPQRMGRRQRDHRDRPARLHAEGAAPALGLPEGAQPGPQVEPDPEDHHRRRGARPDRRRRVVVHQPARRGVGDRRRPEPDVHGSEEPCSLVDAAPLEAIVDGAEPEPVADAEQKSPGWAQSCTMTFGEPEKRPR